MEMHMDVWENKATLNNSSMDEFAVPQDSEKELREQRLHMERIFGVVLNILGVLNQTHMLEQSAGHQQMWIQLQGEKRNIEKAKSYIKGLCTPDITEDTTYPRGLYCIFVGAKGIFLDCLIRATSACIKPLSPGCIRISGLAEEAVMAQSRVQAFLEGSNSCYRPDDDAQIKRDFKDLVEEHTDIHVLDLLILSTSVKEQLLALVHEANISGLRKRRLIHSKNNLFEKPTEITVHSHSNFPTSVPLQNPQTLEKMLSSKPMAITKPGSERRILHHRASNPHQLNVDQTWDYNNRATLFQRQNAKEKPVGLVQDIEYNQKEEEKSREISCTDDEEFRKISGLLGTIMGRDEGEQGSNKNFSLGTEKEFSMLLDFFKTMGYKEAVVLKVLSENGIQEPSQILDKVNLEESNHSQGKLESNRLTLLNESSDTYGNNDDSYVWEVVKSAAKNCGYSPSEIVDKGDGSVAGLLRKLNEKNTNPEHHMNISEVHRYPNQESTRQEKVSCVQPRTELNVSQPDVGMSEMGRHKTMFPNCPVEDHFPGSAAQETCDIKVAKYLESEDGLSAPVVTGAQRFNEAMQTPFELNLRNEPGNEQLRHIIVDGSNVAMIHGLCRFFSCRGIALAVQYFWERGHRNITVFVPQSRIKRDDKVKEQHFLTQLNKLGLLSFTPSRIFEGKRITPYDDRFMLQLAEKTDGVIVTNDNLRDFSEESMAWKNIIRKRLLQFTFVGDIFMVPDDPLGRNGPPLEQFLWKNLRPKTKTKGHSFAGRGGPITSPKPSSQTEVLNLRDRKPGKRFQEETNVRSPRETEMLRCELLSIFPNQDTKVDFILQRQLSLTDLNKLSELIINLRF